MRLMLNVLLLAGYLLYGQIHAEDKKDEITLGKVTTNTKMATPCGQGRNNPKAIMLEIDTEISKHGKDAGSI